MSLWEKAWDFIFGWDRSRASTVSGELEELARIGELMMEVGQHAGDREWAKQLTLQHVARFSVLNEKYGISSRFHDGDPMVTRDDLHRARRYAEIFSAYGYIRGKWKIRREEKGEGCHTH